MLPRPKLARSSLPHAVLVWWALLGSLPSCCSRPCPDLPRAAHPALQSRIFRGLASPLLYILAVSASVAVWNTLVETGLAPDVLPELHMSNNGPFGLTSFALSLLLVFRRGLRGRCRPGWQRRQLCWQPFFTHTGCPGQRGVPAVLWDACPDLLALGALAACLLVLAAGPMPAMRAGWMPARPGACW